VTLDESYEKCLELTRSHYENFPVARLIPKHLRRHVAAVYAFARTADDIADEGYGLVENTPESRIAALARFDDQVVAAAENRPLDPDTAWIFMALGDTLRRFDIPARLCLDLTSAFAQDVLKRRYETFAEVLDYCRRSANPVGRLVLLLHGLKDEVMFTESDAICTGLQLANFWQDISVDRNKDGRTYLPLEDMQRFGVSPADLDKPAAAPATRECIKFNVERAQRIFDSGKKLPGRLPFPLSLEIRVTWLGGTAILQKIRRQDYDSVRSRPKIGKRDKVALLLKALCGRM
jgi:squalene synthase HpnC